MNVEREALVLQLLNLKEQERVLRSQLEATPISPSRLSRSFSFSECATPSDNSSATRIEPPATRSRQRSRQVDQKERPIVIEADTSLSDELEDGDEKPLKVLLVNDIEERIADMHYILPNSNGSGKLQVLGSAGFSEVEDPDEAANEDPAPRCRQSTSRSCEASRRASDQSSGAEEPPKHPRRNGSFFDVLRKAFRKESNSEPSSVSSDKSWINSGAVMTNKSKEDGSPIIMWKKKLQIDKQRKIRLFQSHRKKADSEEREQKSLRLKREHSLEAAKAEWTKHILPQWSTMKHSPKLKELLRNVGVPPQLRGQVWPLAIGNSAMITMEVYELWHKRACQFKDILVERSELENLVVRQSAHKRKSSRVIARAMMRRLSLSEPPSPAPPDPDQTPPRRGPSSSLRISTGLPDTGLSPGHDSVRSPMADFPAPTLSLPAPEDTGKEHTMSQIDIDLTRTFPSLAFFQEGCPMHQQLRDVLQTFCMYRPDIGYIQGMSFLAATLLLYISDPYIVFTCFCNLVNTPFFHAFLKLEPVPIDARCRVLDLLLDANVPDVRAHLQSLDITSRMYFMEWCITLFASKASLEVTSRCWDMYLIEGEQVAYCVGVALLKVLQPELLGQPFETCMQVLSSRLRTINEVELFRVLSKIKFTGAAAEELNRLHIAESTKWMEL